MRLRLVLLIAVFVVALHSHATLAAAGGGSGDTTTATVTITVDNDGDTQAIQIRCPKEGAKKRTRITKEYIEQVCQVLQDAGGDIDKISESTKPCRSNSKGKDEKISGVVEGNWFGKKIQYEQEFGSLCEMQQGVAIIFDWYKGPQMEARCYPRCITLKPYVYYVKGKASNSSKRIAG